MTSPQALQDGTDGSPSHASRPHVRQADSEASGRLAARPIPRIKSTGSLLSYRAAPTDGTHARASFDTAADYAQMPIRPSLPEHDSGLRRIRQYPRSRKPSSPGRLASGSRSSSLTLPFPPSNNGSRAASMSLPSGPPSPVLHFSDDLSRFPQESLHSFSFAHQSEDSMHNRQNVLKRSVDFLRDKQGWAATNAGLVNAQARLTGDQEVQSMMELLHRANLISPGLLNTNGLGIGGGSMTGPADNGAENVFDKSFSPLPHSQADRREANGFASKLPSLPAIDEPPSDVEDVLELTPTEPLTRVLSADSSKSRPVPLLEKRAQLKRTYTDVAGVSLQNRLTEALARPYLASQSRPDDQLISPRTAPTVLELPPRSNVTIAPSGAPHGHGRHGGAAKQAIFTTESHAPYTITSANDLACLVFGVTKSEVRRMGIMEVIREERRKWLESKLRQPDVESASRVNHHVQSHSLNSERQKTTGRGSPSPTSTPGGITAKLLSKPRSTYQSRRSKTVGGNGINSDATKSTSFTIFPGHVAHKSRGVLLCGDVVPIQKRNGALGSASLWVKEKQGGLIWVLEEIAEDVAYLTVDEIGSVTNGDGAVEAIWGLERVRRGMDVRKLLPTLPKLPGTHTGALDYEEIATLRRFTARTSNSISIPVSIDQLSGKPTFRVSSFPHIAGIVVLDAKNLTVTSSNSVFSAALFGHELPDGMYANDLIPSFDKILRLISDEDQIGLVDGIVIPEHSFRRARALLALREGHSDAASIFLRPSGLPAKHRDGSEIMVDVQMRVVKSDSATSDETTIIEEMDDVEEAGSSVAFALWITYSRHLHAVNHGVGPVTPYTSRPGTPPDQPSPTQSPSIDGADSEDSEPSTSVLAQQLLNSATSPVHTTVDLDEPYEHPSPVALAAGAKVTPKKAIADFVILEEMGQGAYGQVKLARYKKVNAKKMVIKYVTKRRILVDTWTRDRRLGTVPLEIHVLDYLRRDGLRHPNIVEMADFFEDDTNYYIEMIPHGLPGMDLFDYIELRVNMEERECRKIFVQVARALHHLHVRAKVVHRDIKDENVVLDGDGAVKLVDFGSAAYIKSGPFDVFVGTIDYAAPEVLRGSPYRGKEQDVWALGILLYTIVYKENPFYSIDEIMDHDLRVPYVMSEDCIDLIRRMLDRDVEKRIGIQAVVDHPWCTFVDDDEDD